MANGKSIKQDDPAQSQRFIDMAREVEAEDAGPFERAFVEVSKLPPGHDPKPKPE